MRKEMINPRYVILGVQQYRDNYDASGLGVLTLTFRTCKNKVVTENTISITKLDMDRIGRAGLEKSLADAVELLVASVGKTP